MGEMVTIPVEEYQALRVAAEELADLRAYDRARDALARGEEEQLPADIARRMVAGEHPLRVWLNRVQIPDIESGKGNGSVATLVKLAAALGVGVDDLV